MALPQGFVRAVDPGGNKRIVPAHYLENDALGFKLPPSSRKKAVTVEEPAATSAKTTIQEPAAAGEK